MPQLQLSVSATTRAPRPGEQHGVDYWFLSDADFDERIAAGDFVEYATYSGRRYGTLRGGLFTFTLPVKLAALTISLLWHPRLEADPAHRWLRGLVKEVCRLSSPPFHGGEKPMP